MKCAELNLNLNIKLTYVKFYLFKSALTMEWYSNLACCRQINGVKVHAKFTQNSL